MARTRSPRLPRVDEKRRRELVRLSSRLLKISAQSADPNRVLINFERLAAVATPAAVRAALRAAPERLELLAKIFAHSQALASTLALDAQYFLFLIAPGTLDLPRDKTGFADELSRLMAGAGDAASRYDAVRRFRRRETLRIGARDLTGRARLEETILELSNLADVCLQAVYEIAHQKLCAQFKIPGPVAALAKRGSSEFTKTLRRDSPRLASAATNSATRFAVIGMGKLGGQELNYSSDVDVIFVYGEDEQLTRMLTAHEFFKKLGEEIIRAVGRPSAEGSIFRIDLRLRPEGSSGPLVRSLDACENYYAQWGETWERMALIKARCVAGDEQLGAEFIEMVQPFVYPKHAGEQIIQQMAAIKQRIEREIVREDRLTRHVKLGIGGIREIEFIVQSFQVLRGAREPVFRDRSTLRALKLLAKHRVIADTDAAKLAEAYRFLRNVEHRLQMEMELQTHTIPDEEHAQFRLARSLGFPSVAKFQAAQNAHTSAVRKIYAAVLASAAERAAQRDEQLLAPEKLPAALAAAGFADVPAALKVVERLLHGPGFGHVSERSKELFARLFPSLLAESIKVADPDAALLRLEKLVTAYGSRALLYELLVSNPRLLEMLVRVCDASRFMADTLTQRPEMFEEICRGGRLAEPKRLEGMVEELKAESRKTKAESADERMDAAREWKRAELLRIGIEDVMGLADLEHVHSELTWLAEACLRFATVAALGERGVVTSRSRRRPRLTSAATGPNSFPFAVIGLGKFGGQELGYGADLDVLFVGGGGAGDQEQAIKVAARVMELMERQTPAGTLFCVDPRLRPDGEKGPLAGSLEAHREYYRQRALTWERQALTKARVVAGDVRLGNDFIEMVRAIVYARGLSAAELAEIKRMRHRVETERGDRAHAAWEFKTGAGGLMDVEFLVQTLQLMHGHKHPQLRTAHTLAALNRLTALGIVEDEPSYQLRRGYLFLRKIESVLRRMDNTSVSKLPATGREQTLLARRLGFGSAAEFLKTYEIARRQNREIYLRCLAASSRRPSAGSASQRRK